MKIFCKNNNIPMSANQQVNRVGKYLYKHFDGAFKFTTSSNTADVYIMLLYEIPRVARRIGYSEDWKSNEMVINISITTYRNKIRVNTIEVSPKARTLGFDLFEPEEMQNLEFAKSEIADRVRRRIVKAYSDYEFMF